MSFQWRRFQFFDKDSFSDDDGRAALTALSDFPNVTASASSVRALVFGNRAGRVRVVNRDYEAQTFSAHDGTITHMALLQRHHVLVTLGDDEQQPTLKFFLLDRLDASGHPQCARRLPVFSSRAFPPSTITCLAVMEDLSQAVVGCVNGQALLLDGALLKDKQPKLSYLIRDIGPTVTALLYREEEQSAATAATPFPLPAAAPSLFLCTSDSVCTFYVRQAKPGRVELDASKGAEPGLAQLTENDAAGAAAAASLPSTGSASVGSALVGGSGRRLVVGRKEAVYLYDCEEQSEVFAFEGAKKLLGWFHHYLAIVTEAVKEVGAPVKEQLTLYDLRNKFIAFQVKSDPIVALLPAFSSLYTLTAPQSQQPLSSSGSNSTASSVPGGQQQQQVQQVFALQHYVEKDLSSKVDILFKKNLYPIAISLALSSSSDPSLIVDIYQQYGDHCYGKGDYDQAIAQYIETIGYTEPSYVIRKFLDAQRIHNLTRYLQALHEKGRANSDHTTLLISAWAKLKEVDKLNAFVRSDVQWVFDVVTAIQVCRQAGYFDHALFLAQKHAQHDLYIKVQLEDINDSAAALTYVKSLPWPDADRFVTKYGKRFVSDLPADTTAVLMQLSTHWQPTPLPNSPHPPALPAGPGEKSNPELFIHFFVGLPAQLQAFLESVQHESQCSSTVYNTLLELYLRRGEEEESKVQLPQQVQGSAQSAASQDSSSAHPYSAQIMNLLKSFHGKYDMDHALVLCKLYHFEVHTARCAPPHTALSASPWRLTLLLPFSSALCPAVPPRAAQKGILYLYAKLSYFSEILQHHVEHRQHSRIIPVCIKYGATLPTLWVQALTHFAHQSDGNYEEEITQVLDHVERMNLLAPLMVIQILSGGGGAAQHDGAKQQQQQQRGAGKPISVLQDYIVKLLKDEQSIITADTAEIVRYQHDTAAMKEEMARLRTQPVAFQVGKCSGCGQALALPAVHFLCMHSYHVRCCDGGRGGADGTGMGGGEAGGSGASYECAKCSAEYRKVQAIRDSLKSSATAHDRFFKQLDDSADGFATVADYFGRGIVL